MSAELALYIERYGYVAIFLMVLLQELGVPNPVTNEFVLLFSGYLAFSGILSLRLVFLTAVSADCIGTTILYLVFYTCGRFILDRSPRWFPLSPAQIKRLAELIGRRKQLGIYVGRLTPFLRGYASVAAGVLMIRPRVYLPAVVLSAVTWSGGYVIAGRLAGPYWEQAAGKIGRLESIALGAALLLAAALIGHAVVRRRLRPRSY